MSINRRFKPKKRQTGSALIIGLTIMLLMLILGTAGMRTTIMEERMAGNSRDYNNAFQAAEAGLLDGEQDINNKDPITNEKLRIKDYSRNDFATDCNIGNTTTRLLDGLCVPATTDPPQWLAINWDAIANGSAAPLPYRIYGQCTTLGNPSSPNQDWSCVAVNNSESKPAYTKTYAPLPLPTISRQSRYIIEYLGSQGSLTIGKTPSVVTNYFRVTAQGYGIAENDAATPRPIARVMLQVVYGK